MNWPDLANELPAPRDDEPSSLRQDIADELADHLHSSFAGELHRTPDQVQAQQHVLDRFGDPRRVARQLWFDALKDKIMSQRVVIAALVVTAIACLGSTGLTFMLVEQSREASQALIDQVERSQTSNAAFLRETREANAALVEKLGALVGPAGKRDSSPATSMEWNPVNIRLVKDKVGGLPAEGNEVVLQGHILDTANRNSVVRKTGADGLANLGVVRPGEHSLKITTPWGEFLDTSITVLPGQSLTNEIICPAANRDEVLVSIAVDWPDELRDRGYWTVCLAMYGNRRIGDTQWRPAFGSNYRLMIVTAGNEIISIPDNYGYGNMQPENPFRFANEPPNDSPGLYFDREPFHKWLSSVVNSGRVSRDHETRARPIRPYHFQFPNAPKKPEESLPAGHYTLQNILVAERPADEAPNEWRIVDVLGGMTTTSTSNLGNWLNYEHPFDDWIRPSERGMANPSFEYQRRVKATPAFEVGPGMPSLIKIPIIPKLKENVLMFLDESMK